MEYKPAFYVTLFCNIQHASSVSINNTEFVFPIYIVVPHHMSVYVFHEKECVTSFNQNRGIVILIISFNRKKNTPMYMSIYKGLFHKITTGFFFKYRAAAVHIYVE